MRLVFVTDTLCSGGAERVISILANYFGEKYDTVIVCLRKRDVFYDIRKNVEIVQSDDFAHGLIGKAIWLRHYFRKDDVIIPFMVKVYCVVLLALLGKKQFIVASERNDPRTTEIQWKILRRLLFPKLSALIVQSQAIKDYFPQKYKNKISIILNPVEIAQCSSKPWSRDSKLVLAIGRTDVQKNYPMMIRAFNRLRQIYPDYRLEIWGSRNEKDFLLQSLIDDLGASESISIHGRTNEVCELYASAYMFVMSSNYEGLSNALIEAMCSSLPTISTKVSGAIDIINDKENGLLVDIGDEEGLYCAIKKLIDEPLFAEKLSVNAKKTSLLFDKNKICSQWENVINDLLL